MIRWLITGYAFLALPAYAQQINVRSGSHEDFARIVLDVPSGTTWTVEPNANGAVLSLDGHDGGFDISGVFDRIDQTFISDVSASPNAISVKFSCNCTADVFPQGSQMVVIDVSETILAEPSVRLPAAISEFVGLTALRFYQEGDEKDPKAMPASDSPDNKELPLSVNRIAAEPMQSVEVEYPSGPSDPKRLRKAQEKLAQHFGNAATRGILSPAGRRIDFDDSAQTPQIDVGVFPTPSVLTSPVTLTEPIPGNLRITSSSDASQGQDAQSTTLGVSCLNPNGVSILEWGSNSGLAQQVAELRGQLYGEFDLLDNATALELAQAYLHYGFGAEARQVMLLDAALAQAHPALMAMSAVMEYGHSAEISYLSHFMDCDSDVALWAILSVKPIDPSQTINTNAALRGVSALPMHLRRFIAPELSQRLLEYGDEAAAAAALRSLERASDSLAPDANLAKADLEMAQGQVDEAQERLAEVVTSNGEQSAEALIKFVDSHLDNDQKIDEGVATLVEAYAVEMRDDPIGEELRRTHVLALGKSGQFSAAFDALSRVRARGLDKGEDSLRSLVLDLLVRNADDVEFLDHAFTQMAITPEALAPQTKFKLAERLTKLGFPEQAEAILAAGSPAPNTKETAILKAEISLALSRPQEAIAHLFGETSDEAVTLRARAAAAAGDFASAHSGFQSLGDEESSRQSAWLSDDWSVVIEEAAPVFGPVVQVAQSALDTNTERDGMLERTAMAISESQTARQVIEDLLEGAGPGRTQDE